MSSDLCYSNGMNNYGYGLEKGYLGKSDLKEAMKYYKMSSDLGNLYGMNNYGLGLDNGYLGTPNINEAIKYLIVYNYYNRILSKNF
jgi:TPR repeat protein